MTRTRDEIFAMDEDRFLEFVAGVFGWSKVEVDIAIKERLLTMKKKITDEEHVTVTRTLKYSGRASKVIKMLENRMVKGGVRQGEVDIIENFKGGTYDDRNNPHYPADPAPRRRDPNVAS